jgi:hypothetical protein
MGLFLYVVMDKKERKYHRNNRRICSYCSEEINKTLSIYSLTNYKVIIRQQGLPTSREKKDAHR